VDAGERGGECFFFSFSDDDSGEMMRGGGKCGIVLMSDAV
jgi:hypothetical protein